jgi:hypothetical protein
MKPLLLVVFLAFTIQDAIAQTSNLDSLKRALAKQAPGDTSKIYTHKKLAGGYAEYNPDSSMYYAKQGLALATKYNIADEIAFYRSLITYGLYINGIIRAL